MSSVRIVCLIAAFSAAFSLAGCGGGKKPGKPLVQQYQEALQVTDGGLRSRRLVAVAQKQKQASDLEGMAASLSAAKEAAGSVADPVSRANALNHLVAAAARLDQSPDDLKQLVKNATKAVEEISDPQAKVLALADVAAATGQHLKNTDGAAFLLKSAETTAGTIESPHEKVRALARIAAAYVKSGLDADGQRVLAQTQELAAGVSDPQLKADCLGELGLALHELKRPSESQAAFAAAQQAAEAIAQEPSRAYALVHLAQKVAAAKQKSEARKLLKQALELANQVSDRSIRAPLIEDIEGASKQL